MGMFLCLRWVLHGVGRDEFHPSGRQEAGHRVFVWLRLSISSGNISRMAEVPLIVGQ